MGRVPLRPGSPGGTAQSPGSTPLTPLPPPGRRDKTRSAGLPWGQGGEKRACRLLWGCRHACYNGDGMQLPPAHLGATPARPQVLPSGAHPSCSHGALFPWRLPRLPGSCLPPAQARPGLAQHSPRPPLGTLLSVQGWHRRPPHSTGEETEASAKGAELKEAEPEIPAPRRPSCSALPPGPRGWQAGAPRLASVSSPVKGRAQQRRRRALCLYLFSELFGCTMEIKQPLEIPAAFFPTGETQKYPMKNESLKVSGQEE